MIPTRPTRRRNLIVALILPLTAVLAGCAGLPAVPPSTAATESAPAAATPTEASADPLEAVAAIVVRPDALELRDADDSVVAEVDYMARPTRRSQPSPRSSPPTPSRSPSKATCISPEA